MTKDTRNSSSLTFHETGYTLAVLLLVLIVPVCATLWSKGRAIPALTVLAACAVMAFVFSSLDVIVENGVLRVRFGGFITVRRVAVRDIRNIRRVQPPPMAGVGIRWSPSGMLFTVSMSDAVAFELRNGSQFLVGSTAPDALCTAIRPMLSQGRDA